MIKSIKVHPIFSRSMSYSEHYAGNLMHMGDSLGRDCTVMSLEVQETGISKFMKAYKNDGSRNEDWFTYESEVLSPVDGKVIEVYVNPVENNPGELRECRSTSITIENDDGIRINLVHVRDIKVEIEDLVVEGQVIALGANNGWSKAPHVHIGAWKNDECYQVEFDLEKMGSIVAEVGECFYFTGYTKEELSWIED